MKLLEPLGKGGFGAVFLAEVKSPGGLVQRMAVKLLNADMERHAEIAARARDEARLMSQLNHDHVVKIYGLSRIAGRWLVLMEYVEGVDADELAQAARRRGAPMPPGVALRIAEATAAALHAAWTTISPQTGKPLHVVHRDIKPANLLLSLGGTVKVLDFGVARGEFDREVYTSSAQFGTARFMAPERWIHGTAGPASDIYSLGVSLWELLTGQRFERPPLAPTTFDEALQERLEALRHALADRDELAARVVPLVGRLLAYEPDDRPTARALEDALGPLVELVPANLRRFAREHVPALLEARREKLGRDPELAQLSGSHWLEETPPPVVPDDELVDATGSGGATFSFDMPTQDEPAPTGPVLAPPAPKPAPSRLGVTGALVGLLVVGVAVGTVLRGPPEQEQTPTVVEQVAAPEPVEPEAEVPDPPADVEDAPVQEDEPEEQPEPVEAVTVTPTPVPTLRPVAELEPEPDEPEPKPELVLVSLKLLSDPRGGTFFIDGVEHVVGGNPVELEVGRTYDARFEGVGWSMPCDLEPKATHVKILARRGVECSSY